MEKQPATNPDFVENKGAPPPYPGPPDGGDSSTGAYSTPASYGFNQVPPITQQPQNVTVVIQQTTFLGPHPVNMTCPKCSAQIVSRVDYESGLLTWLLCGGIAIFGCFYGCCLIPFCVDSCKNAAHSCPNCNQYIGTYRRIG